ncbi:MaoC/PaaZ C-terminal domain-containing protein, partial [Pseudomonas aeruginosa]|uniref:MaoC/PaaZ C-terminal domain-containing protein n=1 Tax=Pseudomonas aeruginosa TaxID=287 RepID=UPI003003CFB5
MQALQQWAASERVSGVTHVDQARIDAFADATGDHNWIHVDPGRAQTQLPGGQTIAHGFLLLSLTVQDDVAALAGFPGIAHVL